MKKHNRGSATCKPVFTGQTLICDLHVDLYHFYSFAGFLLLPRRVCQFPHLGFQVLCWCADDALLHVQLKNDIGCFP